jgi:hypothetical protein
VPPPTCSFDFAALYYGCHGRFPSSGAWDGGDRWVPADCTLAPPPAQAPAGPLGSCLFRPDGPAHIVMMGDSQAGRYARALLRALTDRGVARCRRTAFENNDYYGGNLVHKRRDCGGCDSWTESCTSLATGRSVTIEYVVLEFLIDFELSEPERIHWDHNCDFRSALPCKWAWSTQQVVFERYFRSRPTYPDAIAIFQNIHDCGRRDAADFRRDLRWLLSLIHDAVPASSRVFFWEAAALNSAKQPMVSGRRPRGGMAVS